MRYVLYRPNSSILKQAGFGAIAHIPCIFSEDWNYQREASRYLRQRALGQALPLDTLAKIPTSQSLVTIGRWLTDFLTWCDWAGTTWKEVEYIRDIILRYQQSMRSGAWSVSQTALASSTINNRVGEAVNYCAWAVRVGLREKPFDIPYETTYRKSHGLTSHSRSLMAVRSRKQSVRSKPRDLVLPSEQKVADWLHSVKVGLGKTKNLMCRLTVEVGLRRQEVVEWD